MEVQEELDELKQEKRNVKRQIQLADDIIKEDLFTAYYAVTGKEEIVADRDVEIPGMEDEPVDKAGWIVRRISELGGYENVSDSVKADVFGFDITDVSGSIKLFSDVMKRLGIKLDGDELYEEFQRIYDESVGRDINNEKVEDKMWNRGRGR